MKIPHCGVAVIPNPAVCDVGTFKPRVFGETELFAELFATPAVSTEFESGSCALDGIWDFVMCLLSGK